MGAEAFQRAKQALTLATGYLQHEGIGVTCVPKRKKVVVDNKHITLVKLTVKVMTSPSPSAHFYSDTAIKAKDLPRA